MSFCFLYNVVSENHSVQNSPRGGGGSVASSRSIMRVFKKLMKYIDKKQSDRICFNCCFLRYFQWWHMLMKANQPSCNYS